MTLTLELPPDQKRRLEEEAARAGKTPEEYALGAIEARLAEPPPEPRQLTPAEIRDSILAYKDLPRRYPEDVDELARAQGVKPVTRLEDLMGNFWPEDESIDEFIEWLRESRRDGEASRRELD
jgi:hypothetical protein